MPTIIDEKKENQKKDAWADALDDMSKVKFEPKDTAYIKAIPNKKKYIKEQIDAAINKGQQETQITTYKEWLPERAILEDLLKNKYDIYVNINATIKEKHKRYELYVSFNKNANGKVFEIKRDPLKQQKLEINLDDIY